MVASAWDFYNGFTEYSMDGTMDMNADTFRLGLYLSTSNANVLTNDLNAALTNEHANANGYTTGGIVLSSVTWNRSGGTTTFDSADPVWTATGGSLVFRYGVIWDDTPSSPLNPNCMFTTYDTTPADITVTDTNTFTSQMNASGIFTLST